MAIALKDLHPGVYTALTSYGFALISDCRDQGINATLNDIPCRVEVFTSGWRYISDNSGTDAITSAYFGYCIINDKIVS